MKIQIKSFKEDTVKQGDHWVNKGDKGTHGKFKTKKAADAQRKAMFANGYHESELQEVTQDQFDKWDYSRQQQWLRDHPNSKFGVDSGSDGNSEPPAAVKQDMDNWVKNKTRQLKNHQKQDITPEEQEHLNNIKVSKQVNKQAKELAQSDKKFATAYKNAVDDYKWKVKRAEMWGWDDAHRDKVVAANKALSKLLKDNGIEVPEKYYPLGK